MSRDVDAILEDVRQLRDYGMLEINLIAQDTTTYGADRGERDGLAGLFERIAEVAPEIPWIRVLYAFPGFITPRLIAVMRDIPQVLPYIDLPLQHADPGVLRRMRRPADMDQVRRTLADLRSAMPDVALRTTLIVGFPGRPSPSFARWSTLSVRCGSIAWGFLPTRSSRERLLKRWVMMCLQRSRKPVTTRS